MAATQTPYRLGTRASPLAMAQAHMVQAALMAAHGLSADQIEIVPVTTEGDRVIDRPLAEIGGKALWTKTLDAKLLAGEIDFAVHSMKDVETLRPDAIVLAAVLERADPRDRLIGADSVDALPHGAVVGTSSPRRAAQLRRLRPDLSIVTFRGNVATRLARLEKGEAQATMLAAAGLDRLGMSDIGTALSIETMLPAASQGAVGIEARAGANDMRAFLSVIDHHPTRQCVDAERALLAALNADCHSPVGAHARFEDQQMVFSAELLSEDGALHVARTVIVETDTAPAQLAAVLLDAAPEPLRALFG